MPHGWDDAPQQVRAQVSSFAARSQEIFGDALASLYLHGSLAMGCFNPRYSDVDLLVIASRAPTPQQLDAFARATLDVSGSPAPVDVSVVRADDLEPFVHPMPYDFHFSEDSRADIERACASGSDGPPVDRSRDRDLAAHVAMSIARGVALAGSDLRALTTGVPIADWIDAIVSDVDEVRGVRRGADPVYAVLNCCRAFRFLLDTMMSSKLEGGTWAIDVVPAEHVPTVRRVVDACAGDRSSVVWDAEIDACVDWIAERIDQIVAARGFSSARSR